MSAPSDSDALSTMSDPAGLCDHFGGLYNPEMCWVDLNSNGRFANGIHVYCLQKMVQTKGGPGGRPMGFPGILFMKSVHEGSLLKYSATIASEDYIDKLVSLSKIAHEDAAGHTGILFKCPTIESNDRVGKSAIIKHRFPCKETLEHTKEAQAKISNDSVHHTLILVPEYFDNRVFSSDDMKIEPHFSCPDPEEVREIGMRITQFHIFWRIAYRGQAFPLDEAGDDSLADIIKAARAMKPF